MMQRNQTLTLLKKQISRLHDQYGVRHLALFGSVVRDEAIPESDVDVLVEFENKASFDRFMDLKFFLEDTLHARVELVTQNALKPRLRPFIEKELIRVT